MRLGQLISSYLLSRGVQQRGLVNNSGDMILSLVIIMFFLMRICAQTTTGGCRDVVRATCGPESKYACSNYPCLKSCLRQNRALLRVAGCIRDSRYPASWGKSSDTQTKDLRPSHGGTLARWIEDKMREDAAIRSGRYQDNLG